MTGKKLQLMIASLLICISAYSQMTDTAKVKSEFKPSGKIWGYAFGDYAYKLEENSAGMTNTQYASYSKDHNTFEFRRIYLGYDYDISRTFSSQFILSYEGGTLPDGNRSVFIKVANVRWKNIFRNSDLVFGQQSTPTYSTTSEQFWGYRSLEKTIMDARRIGNSSELGISLQGKLNDRGDYGYNLMVANGTGTKLETDKYKKVYADFFARFLNRKIMVNVGADNEIVQTSPYDKSKTTLKAFIGYQNKDFAFGAEAFQQLQKNGTVYNVGALSGDTLNNAVVSGVSVFIRGAILPDKLNFVLRYDYFNPDLKYKNENTYAAGYPSYFKESFVIGALDYMPVKNVHIMPNIWFNRYYNRGRSQNNLSKNSDDLVARITVYYLFR